MFKSHPGFQLTGVDVSRTKHQLLNNSGAAPTHESILGHNRSAPSSSWLSASPFASISSNMFSHLGKESKDPTSRTEPNTGFDFPLEFCHLKKAKCPSLAGLGVRTKSIAFKTLNVYAVGVYVDTAAARSALGQYKNKSVDQLIKDQSFYDAVVQSDAVEKSLRMVISNRFVDQKKFVDALEERLAPRLKQAGESAVLDVFRGQFAGIKFRPGLELAFVTGQKGELVTKVAGQQVGSITSPALVHSLFDVYLGSDPVSKDAKATFGQSLAAAFQK